MTAQKPSLTVSDKLLIAAYHLDGGKDNHFSAESLVVSAWKHFPRTFGLRGFDDENGLPRYPDSNRVFAEIMGSKPIRKRGYLTKVGVKLYALTPSGRSVAQRLDNSDSSIRESLAAGGKATMSRPIRSRLERLLRARAVQRAQTDELDRITFHDACMFWGITPSSTSIELEGALADVGSVIASTEEAIDSGASELRTGSKDLTVSTTDLLRRVHSHLQERFQVELTTIGMRTDQRKDT